jgi:hypothetical protein
MILLKFLYWIAVVGDFLMLLGVLSALKPETAKDFWVFGLIVVAALLFLVGMSVLFIRHTSLQWRLSVLALVVLVPVSILSYVVLAAFGVVGMRR